MNRRKFILAASGLLVPAAFGMPPTQRLVKVLTRKVRQQQVQAPSGSYLVNETFESSEYDNAWTEFGDGTIDGDFSTTGLGMDGNQCLKLVYNTSSTGIYLDLSQPTEIVCKFKYRYSGSIFSARRVIEFITNLGDTLLVQLFPGSIFKLNASGPETVGTLSDNTTVFCWIHIKGGNGVGSFDFEFQSTDNRLGSGDNFISLGSLTYANVNRVRLLTSNVFTAYYDSLKIAVGNVI